MDANVEVHGDVAVVTYNDDLAPTPYWNEPVNCSVPHKGWTVWSLDVDWTSDEWEAWFALNFIGSRMDNSDGDSAYIIDPVPKGSVYGLVGYSPPHSSCVIIPASFAI